MAEEKDTEKKNDTFRWMVGSLIALLAAGGGIAAIYNTIHPTTNSNDNTPVVTPSPSPSGKQVTNVSPTPEITKCKIRGTIFALDKNNSPMADVKVYLIDDKHPDIYLGRTAPNGIFEEDCSQIPSDNFPKKVKAVTSSSVSLIENELPISQQGNENLNIYISEKNLEFSKFSNGSVVRPLQIFRVSPIPANNLIPVNRPVDKRILVNKSAAVIPPPMNKSSVNKQ